MTNWYHHDPARGRVGPFLTEELLARYRSRLIQADTLVWHDGLREWQPLERALGDLALALGPQDTSLPPPLPAHVPGPVAASRPAIGARPVVARKKGMSGCLIALIVVGVLSVPMLAIMAAIALPAYRDYTVKARLTQAIAQSAPVRDALIAHVEQAQACPVDGDPGFEDPARFATPLIASVAFGVTQDGACAYAMTLRGLGAGLDGSTAVIAMRVVDDEYAFDYECSAGTLPANFEPSTCRSPREE